MGNVPGALLEFEVFVMLVKDLFQEGSGGKIRPYFLHKFRKWAEQGAREDVFEWFGHKGLFGVK
jgi:hypothetical protein